MHARLNGAHGTDKESARAHTFNTSLSAGIQTLVPLDPNTCATGIAEVNTQLGLQLSATPVALSRESRKHPTNPQAVSSVSFWGRSC